MAEADAQSSRLPPRLSHQALVEAQQHTLATPKRRYRLDARALFTLMDLVYGTPRTLSKFKVLEIVARVPYQVWEQVAYVAITHVHRRTGLASRIHDRVLQARAQQDNEQWHLFVLEELIARSAVRESQLKYFWLSQAMAFVYYQLAWLLYVLRPAWSYQLNADFEDHAEHEYMAFVAEHPEWETTPFDPDLADEYGQFTSLADVFRQIGHDERVHKEESTAQMRQGRFQ